MVSHATTQTYPRTARPCCPRHNTQLDGGPVVYWCPTGHGLQAADIDNEHIAHLAVTS